MADNYVASILALGQAKTMGKVNEFEQRRRIPTVMETALKNQSYSNPDLQLLKTSLTPDRPTKAYYFKKVDAGSATTKSYQHTGTPGDTGYTDVTYISAVETFTVPFKMGANNVYTYAEMYANRYMEAWRNLRTRQDTSALAFLASAKNQQSQAVMNALLASAGLGNNLWNETNYALEIPYSLQTTFVRKIEDAMRAQNFMGQFDTVMDLQLASMYDNYYAQGGGNFQNLGWQFGNQTGVPVQIALDSNYSDQNGTAYIMPKGTFYGLNWNEQANKTGLPPEMSGASIGYLTTLSDPFGSGAVADVSTYTQRADTSSYTAGGNPEDFLLQVELTLTIGYIAPPLSTSGDSVIMEAVAMAQNP